MSSKILDIVNILIFLWRSKNLNRFLMSKENEFVLKCLGREDVIGKFYWIVKK